MNLRTRFQLADHNMTDDTGDGLHCPTLADNQSSIQPSANRRHNMRYLPTALILVAASIAWLTFDDPVHADEPVQIKVLCYNIHHAEGVDSKLDLQRIAKVIQSVAPDIVALQEVDRNATRSQSVDQPAELARLCKMEVVFGANIPLQGGHYGNAILSRHPIMEQRNHLLPNLENGEQRGVLVAEIQMPSIPQTLVMFATHLDHRRADHERVASAQMINELATKYKNQPAILAGDMNDVIDSATLNTLEKRWTRTNPKPLPTIPVTDPTRQIDFVLVSAQDRWKVVDVTVLSEAVASDHRPILATLELSPATNP
ncbi:Endonuclease/Exonuclease/phosphatase family protein [Rubripirellula lacrimiformis]|uniref:Endonuclease/Exonuclease/phosphatase family protein n=1 Tax=Rubripirellula lacrimiformis TaxID=1930273 RepID=A0A517NE61_9BACT|nr:endonuclease/exonuclease/phosphatase family protein [Rubripirellula lacrimiformis]QDT05414.1 Endonuclease/Exonuclease/phosphatase family protein [Rubripirellula lacrimiformis]